MLAVFFVSLAIAFPMSIIVGGIAVGVEETKKVFWKFVGWGFLLTFIAVMLIGIAKVVSELPKTSKQTHTIEQPTESKDW